MNHSFWIALLLSPSSNKPLIESNDSDCCIRYNGMHHFGDQKWPLLLLYAHIIVSNEQIYGKHLKFRRSFRINLYTTWFWSWNRSWEGVRFSRLLSVVCSFRCGSILAGFKSKALIFCQETRIFPIAFYESSKCLDIERFDVNLDMIWCWESKTNHMNRAIVRTRASS